VVSDDFVEVYPCARRIRLRSTAMFRREAFLSLVGGMYMLELILISMSSSFLRCGWVFSYR